MFQTMFKQHPRKWLGMGTALLAAISLMGLAGCITGGGGADAGAAITRTSDPAASKDAKAVQKYLAALTRGTEPGVVAGQNAGDGPEIARFSDQVGYFSLLDSVQQASGQTPGMVGVDYEHDSIYTPEQLSLANQRLIEHWKRGGLVTISWSPHSPWLNDERDIAGHPGEWADTQTKSHDPGRIDLRELLDPSQPRHAVWRRKLDRVAAALQELQQAGVVVLWRPMAEMNGDSFWWGQASSPQDPELYKAVWRDMHRYLTQAKGLHNLLWVYSPYRGPVNAAEAAYIRPVDWAYPGAELVDVVAGVSYSDTLDIADYAAYLSFGKPVAMGEYGLTLQGSASLDGSFDTTRYIQRLQQDYPAVAYWVSWHNWSIDGERVEHQALTSQRNVTALMQAPATITRSRVKWKAYR